MTAADDAIVEFGDPSGAPPRAAGSNPETSQCECFAAALHELSERLTAATNYLASGLRQFEPAAADTARSSEALVKALGQLDQAGNVVNSLWKLLREQGP